MRIDGRPPTYQRSSSALWRRVGSTFVVTTSPDPEIHELLGGAGAVWDELADPKELPELIERLASTHEVSAEALEGDVPEVLETLRRLGVVEEIGGARA